MDYIVKLVKQTKVFPYFLEYLTSLNYQGVVGYLFKGQKGCKTLKRWLNSDLTHLGILNLFFPVTINVGTKPTDQTSST